MNSSKILLFLALVAAALAAVAARAAPITVASLKLIPKPGDKAGNYARFEQFAREAAGGGAKLIVTSECYLDGYLGHKKMHPEMTFEKLASFAETVDGPYSKSHIEAAELYSAGTDFPVFDTALGRIGLLICYDRQLPETSRLLALQGAELIVVPAHSQNVDLINEDLMMRVRAYENNVFVVLHSPFNSLAADPSGELIARRGPESGEGILYSKIDLSQRDPGGGPIARRHPELYHELAGRVSR